MKIREVLMTIAVLYPIAGYSASFDCQKATQADEKAICANRSLNDMDVVMATKYQFLRGFFQWDAWRDDGCTKNMAP